MKEPTYGVVGRGRMASHMTRYLELEHRTFRVWNRGMKQTPEETLAHCDIILLLISDDALAAFRENHRFPESRGIVHFSGSRTFEDIVGLHPLTTFGPDLYSLETYRAVPFIEERGGTGFGDIFPGFLNPTWSLDAQMKPLYHALCVMSGNFTGLLWAKAMSDFEDRLGLPGEVLLPYLNQTCRNVAASGRRSLTGPLVRGDRETIRRNLEALHDDPWSRVYREVAAVFEGKEVPS